MSTLAAGAGSAIALVPSAPQEAAVPAAQTIEITADPGALHDAVDELARQTTALEAELRAAKARLDAERKAAAAAPASRAAAAAPAPAPVRRPAPAVHTRTGASGGGEHEHEHEGHGDD